MSHIAKKVCYRVEVLAGDNVLIARDVEVRNQGELDVAVADTLRQQRLTDYDRDRLAEFTIRVIRLKLAKDVFELRKLA